MREALRTFALVALPLLAVPVDAAPRGVQVCSSAQPCRAYRNLSTGPGLSGTSAQGHGLVGTSRGVTPGPISAGVFGENESHSPTIATVGVYGGARSVFGIGVFGSAYDGVVGAGKLYGAYGESLGVKSQLGLTGSGVAGYGPTGVTGITFKPGHAGVLGSTTDVVQPNSAGVYGLGGSVGVFGSGDIGVVARAQVGLPFVALQAEGGGGTIFRAVSLAGKSVATIDDAGNLIVAGTVVAGGNPPAARLVEDVGETRLVNGRQDVALSPALRKRFDPARPYVVFLTATGETPGLYVSARGPRGFTVRENLHGTGSVAFMYRVAGYGRAAEPTSLQVTRHAGLAPPAHVSIVPP